MGLFDLFRSFHDTDNDTLDSQQPFSSFSSKIVKIVCRKDETGVTKCEKVTQSSSDPTNSSYEETREDYTQDQDQDFKNAFNHLSFKFNFGPDLFSEIENEFENLFSFTNHPHSTNHPRFHPAPQQFQPRHPEYNQKDTNIYDI